MDLQTDLLTPMISAATTAFGERWPQIEGYARTEFTKIGQQLVQTELDLVNKAYGEETARVLFGMQMRSTEAVLVAVSEMLLLAVQAALNAVLAVIKDVVNAALKFALIP